MPSGSSYSCGSRTGLFLSEDLRSACGWNHGGPISAKRLSVLLIHTTSASVLRVASPQVLRRNKSTGDEFWGCSMFRITGCKGKPRDVSQSVQERTPAVIV